MMTPHTIVQRHPLCAGPHCDSCDRRAAELEARRTAARDRLNRLGTDDMERAMHWLAHENPDVVQEALDASEAGQ